MDHKPLLSAKLKATVMKRFRAVVKLSHKNYRRKDIEREADAMYMKLIDEIKAKPAGGESLVNELEAAVRGMETPKADIKLVRADQLPRLIAALARDGVAMPGPRKIQVVSQ